MAGPYDYWMGDIALRGGDIWEKSLRQQQDLQRGNIMPQDMPQYQAFKSMWEKMQQGGMNNMLRQASLRGMNVAGAPQQFAQQTMGAPLQYGQQLLQQAYNPQAGIQATQTGLDRQKWEEQLKLMYAQLREQMKSRKQAGSWSNPANIMKMIGMGAGGLGGLMTGFGGMGGGEGGNINNYKDMNAWSIWDQNY